VSPRPGVVPLIPLLSRCPAVAGARVDGMRFGSRMVSGHHHVW
jgi:hypothetical protein